jgi:hypothetical protein
MKCLFDMITDAYALIMHMIKFLIVFNIQDVLVSHWKTVIVRWTGRGLGWTCASGQLKSRAEAQRV